MPTVSQHYIRQHGHAGRAGATGAAATTAPVVLMVSGGADSTALLLMACTGALDIQDGRGRARIARERLHVLHVNHHLRGAASDADEAFVRDLCERLGVPLCVEHAAAAVLEQGNLEAAAREVRYAAARRYVRDLCREAGVPRTAARIATAHTASDRAETFFMNAIRGSGSAGLSSIPRRRNVIVRPLLDATHEDLVRYLEVAGQPWREDESNRDTSYLRNFVRHRLMPLARERNAELAHSVGAACDILGAEDAFMSQLAATAWRSCVREERDGLVVLDAARLAAAEVAIARRMVRLTMRRVAPEARLEMRHVEAVLACVASGSGSLTLPEGVDARVEFGMLSFRTARARETVSAGWLPVPGRMPQANQMVLEASLARIPADADASALARELAAAPGGSVWSGALAGGAEEAPGGSALPLGSRAGSAPSEDPMRPQGLGARAASPDGASQAWGLGGAAGVARAHVVLADARALGYEEGELARALRGEQGSTVRVWVDGPAPGDVMCPLGMHGRSKKLSDLLGEAQVPVAQRASVPVVRTSPSGAVVWVAGVRLDERFRCHASTRVALRLVLREVG